MATNTQPLTRRPAWKALETHFQKIRNLHLRDLFASDPGRGARLTVEAVGIYLDYSKNLPRHAQVGEIRQFHHAVRGEQARGLLWRTDQGEELLEQV